MSFQRDVQKQYQNSTMTHHDKEMLVNGEHYKAAQLTNVTILQSPNKNVCFNKNVFLVVSSPENLKLRNKVRLNLKPRSGVVFLIGQRDESISKMLEAENLKNGDILQGTITDSYKTIANKIILGILWIEK